MQGLDARCWMQPNKTILFDRTYFHPLFYCSPKSKDHGINSSESHRKRTRLFTDEDKVLVFVSEKIPVFRRPANAMAQWRWALDLPDAAIKKCSATAENKASSGRLEGIHHRFVYSACCQHVRWWMNFAERTGCWRKGEMLDPR